jgi:hypothetical protein
VSAEAENPSPNTFSRRYNDAVPAPGLRQSQNNPIIIDLDDSDSDDEIPIKSASLERDVHIVMNRGQKSQEAARPEDDPDEEFPELVAKARERARQQEKQQYSSHTQGVLSASEMHVAPEEPDPIISILIEPRIANTAPLLVKRKYRQNFKEVRLAWCAKNEIPEETRHTVFFTWRGRRIFDVASCRSIGIKLDLEGRPFMKRPEDGYTEVVDKIVLIATTLEIEEELKKQKELEAKEKERAARSPSPERKEPQYKVVMRSKGHADQKLLVREVC